MNGHCRFVVVRLYLVIGLAIALHPQSEARAQTQPPASSPPAAANGVGSQFEMVFWQSVVTSDDRAQFEAYLAKYPDGTFATLARAKIAALDKRSPATAGTAAAPPPVTRSQQSAPVPPPLVAVAAPGSAPAGPPAPPIPTAAIAPSALPPSSAPSPSSGPTAMGSAALGPTAPGSAAPVATPSTVAPAVAPVGASGGPNTQPPAPAMSLSEQLRALAKTQGPPTADASGSVGRVDLPARPVLTSFTKPVFPNQFCSGFARNAFYDTDLKPVVDASDKQYRTTVDHMRKLQQLYEDAVQRRDLEAANIFAAEAKAYEPITKEAYAARLAFDAEFSRLMSTPIVKCEGTP